MNFECPKGVGTLGILSKSHQMMGNASKSVWELILDRFEVFSISFEVFVWSPIGGSIYRASKGGPLAFQNLEKVLFFDVS